MGFGTDKSWSLSRSNILDECPRKYYYNYYLANNNCNNNEKSLVSEVKRLKKLSNRYFLSGNLIHEVAKGVITSIVSNRSVSIDMTTIKENTVNNFKDPCKDDLKILKYNSTNVSKVKLMEYFYEGEITHAQGTDVLETIESCLDNLLHTKTVSEIRNNNINIIENSDGNFNNFLLKGTKTFAMLDLLYNDNISCKYIIVDWKTGKENVDDKNQLLLYALYVMSKYKVSIDNIVCRCEYLKNGSYKEYTFDQMDVDVFTIKVDRKLKDMDSYLTNINTNMPKEVNYFNTTTQLSICKMCNFKKVCDGYSYNLNSTKLCHNN